MLSSDRQSLLRDWWKESRHQGVMSAEGCLFP